MGEEHKAYKRERKQESFIISSHDGDGDGDNYLICCGWVCGEWKLRWDLYKWRVGLDLTRKMSWCNTWLSCFCMCICLNVHMCSFVEDDV